MSGLPPLPDLQEPQGQEPQKPYQPSLQDLGQIIENRVRAKLPINGVEYPYTGTSLAKVAANIAAESASTKGAAQPQEPQAQPQARYQEPVTTPQEPQGPPTATEQKMADGLARMAKFRADQLMRGQPNDMGGWAHPPITDPAEATKVAQQALQGFIAANSGNHPEAKKSMQGLRDFLDGKSDMPREWVLDETPAQTPQGLYAQKAQEGREAVVKRTGSSLPLIANDYLFEPIGRFAGGAVQARVIDPIVGVANLFGQHIKPVDVRASALAGIRALTGEGYDPRRAALEIGGMQATAPAAAQFVQRVADIGGMLEGFRGGPAAIPLAAGEITGKWLAALGTRLVGGKGAGATKVGKAISEVAGGAGALGVYEAVAEAAKHSGNQTLEQELEAAGHGAIAGGAMASFAGVARWGLRRLFSEAAKSTKVTGEDGKIIDALKDWAKANKIEPLPHQSIASYGARAVDSWIAGGMKGAPKMTARKLIGRALEMGTEATGLSTLDTNFWHDAYEGIANKDPEAFKRAIETYGANFLGIAASRMRLSQIPGFQRQQPTQKSKAPVSAETLAQEAQGRQRMEEDLQRARTEHRAEMDRITREANEKGMANADETNVALQEERARHRSEMEQITRTANEQGQAQEASAAAELSSKRAEHRAQMEREMAAAEAKGEAGAADLERLRAEHRALMDQEYAAAAAQGEQERQGLARQGEADAARNAEAEQRGRQAHGDLEAAFWRGIAEGDPATIAAMGQQGVGDLLRQGWEVRRPQSEIPSERTGGDVKLETPLPAPEMRGQRAGRLEFEMPGTDFSFQAYTGERGDQEAVIYPSPKLRELLSLPESMPPKEFVGIVNKSGIFAALDAGTLLPGEQISASPPIYATPDGKMRTVAIDGTVLESPLGPDPKWAPAESVPARGKDPIGPVQQQVVDALTDVLNTRTDLSQGDAAALSKGITKLDAVSWQKDQAVADTLAHAEDLLGGISGGSPEHAGRAIQAMNEMLTTKAPEVAIDDLSREQEARQLTRETRERLRQEREGQQPTEHTAEPPVSGTSSEPKTDAQRTSEGGSAPSRAGEAGFIDVGAIADETAEAIRRVVRAVTRMPLRAVGQAVGPIVNNPMSRYISLAAQEKAREQLPEPVANRLLQAETNAREYIDEFSPLVEEIPGTNVRELEAVREAEPTPSGVVPLYSVAQIAKETVLHPRFGFDLEQLSEQAKSALEPWNKLTREIRRAASALKMHVQGLWTPEGELAEIAPEAKKDVMPRYATPELIDAMRRPGHWLREATVDMLASENNMAREDVVRILEEDGWTDARSLKRRDPIEHMRRFKYFADHVKVPGHGTVRLLETQPLLHAQRMMNGAAMRFGAVKELGPDDPLPTDPTARAALEKGLPSDGLPTPYLSLVNSVPEGARDAAAYALRSLMGMQTNPLPHDVLAGGGWHKLGRLIGALNSTRASGKMTFGTLISNLFESFSTGGAMLGLQRIGAAAAEVLPRIAAGEWRDLMRERQEAGGFAIQKGAYLLGGEQSTFDQTMRALHTTGNVMTMPLRLIQSVTDIVVHKALHNAVADWREGTHGTTDADALMTIFGFSRAHAEQVVNGEAPPQAYRQIEMNGLTRITRTGDLPINKSEFARSRHGLAQMIKYTGYFQAQFAKLRKAVLNLREAETSAQQITATTNLGKLMGFNMANFMVGAAATKLAIGGIKELLGYLSETKEDASTPAGAASLALKSAVGSMAGSIGSAVTGGLEAMFTGNDQHAAELLHTIIGTVPLVGGAVDDWNFGNAMLHNLTGKPLGEDSEYAGKTPLQQIGYYAGKQIPAVKWAEGGPFGLGITYLGTDPQLENALKASRRVDLKFGFAPEATPRKEDDKNEDQINDRDLFVDTMREAVNKLKAREEDVDVSDVAQAIRDAMPDQDDKQIAQSFLNRRIFSGKNWTQLSEKQQESKLRSLGKDRVELLEGYDAVLERAAAFFKPIGRRRRR